MPGAEAKEAHGMEGAGNAAAGRDSTAVDHARERQPGDDVRERGTSQGRLGTVQS
jgi:hypothetical protein